MGRGDRAEAVSLLDHVGGAERRLEKHHDDRLVGRGAGLDHILKLAQLRGQPALRGVDDRHQGERGRRLVDLFVRSRDRVAGERRQSEGGKPKKPRYPLYRVHRILKFGPSPPDGPHGCGNAQEKTPTQSLEVAGLSGARLTRIRAMKGVILAGGTGSRLHPLTRIDRKSTRLNSSHLVISYAVFWLKKKKNNTITIHVYHPRHSTYYHDQTHTHSSSLVH